MFFPHYLIIENYYSLKTPLKNNGFHHCLIQQQLYTTYTSNNNVYILFLEYSHLMFYNRQYPRNKPCFQSKLLQISNYYWLLPLFIRYYPINLGIVIQLRYIKIIIVGIWPNAVCIIDIVVVQVTIIQVAVKAVSIISI